MANNTENKAVIAEKTITRGRNLSFEVRKNNDGNEYLNVQFEVPIPDTTPGKDRVKEINYLTKIIIEKFNIMSSYTEIDGVNQALTMHFGMENALIYARIGIFASMIWFYRRGKKYLISRWGHALRWSIFLTAQLFSYAFLKSFTNNIYEMYVNELLGSNDNQEKLDYFSYKNTKNVNLTFVEPLTDVKKL